MTHVLPVNDSDTHEETTTCKCNPLVEMEDEILVIHHSFDGREALEQAKEILKRPE